MKARKIFTKQPQAAERVDLLILGKITAKMKFLCPGLPVFIYRLIHALVLARRSRVLQLRFRMTKSCHRERM